MHRNNLILPNSHFTIPHFSPVTLLSAFLSLCIAFSPITTYAAEPPVIEIQQISMAEDEIRLQKIALAEAESEGVYGMALVMSVIMNRVASPDFPDTIEEVIKQDGQFAAYSSGRYDEMEPTAESWEALNLLPDLRNEGQLFFEVTTNDSWQSRNLEFVYEYRRHSFYRPKGGRVRMKIFTQFVCEICGTTYSIKSMCDECEKRHIKPKSIDSAKFLSVNNDRTGLPTELRIMMENGKIVTYRRKSQN